jgi:excisionase family DNA binding protein
VSKLLTKADVAELLGLSTRSVDRLRAGGELPAVRVRGRVRFRPEDVVAYVERLSRGGRR